MIFRSLALLIFSAHQILAHAGWMPLTDRELAKAFRVKVIEDQLLCPPSHLPVYSRRLSGITVQLGGPQERLRFSGQDTDGRRWEVFANPGMSGALYQADLDRDGQKDLIYAGFTGGNGMSPSSHLFILLRDQTQRPVAIELEGYFSFDKMGIRELLDLDNDGKAELIRQDYDDGYWVTSLYEFRANRAHLIRGQIAGRNFPLYTRFLANGSRKSVQPKTHRHPREIDLSNEIGSQELIKLASAKFDEKTYRWKLLTSNGSGFCVNPQRGTAVVTVDAKNFRKVVTLSIKDEFRSMLARIVQNKLSVVLTGERFERGEPGEGCIESIWAFDNR